MRQSPITMRHLLLILCLVSIAGCGSKPESDANRHYERDGGYSLVMPAGWQAKDLPGFKYKVITEQTTADFSANICVVDESHTGSLDEYVLLNLESLAKVFPDHSVNSQQDYQLDSGRRSVKVVIDNPKLSGGLEQTFYFVDGPRKKYVISCTKLSADNRELSEVFDASARSLREE